MRRIFTSSFIAAALVAASFNSFGQCNLSTTPNGAPGATNFFAAGAEGFGGDFAWTGNNPSQQSLAGAPSPAELISPIYYLAPGLNTILARMDIGRGGSVTITGVNVFAQTNAGNIALCNFTGLSITPTTGGTAYYFTLPRGTLQNNVNFRLHVDFTYTGGGSVIVDNFGINASTAQGSLPVKFSSFEGKSVNGGVNLVWNVATEENVARYEVEKSADNRNFSTIGSVQAKGSDSYSFVDTKATTATAYYRVKGVDVDGKLTYSPIVTMKGGKSLVVLKAFPMPVISDLTVQHETAAAGSEISVSSAEGRQVKTVVPAKGSQQTVISLASLTPGVYVIRYSNVNGEVETLKIVKQ